MGLFSHDDKKVKAQVKHKASKQISKPSPKPQSKPAPKPVPKPMAKPVPKPVVKPAPKPVIAPKPLVKIRPPIISESEAVYDVKKVPVVTNVSESKTRMFRPKIDQKKCQKTYNCFMFCPRNAINIGKEGFPEINYALCDGCLICLRECPSVAIIEEKE